MREARLAPGRPIADLHGMSIGSVSSSFGVMAYGARTAVQADFTRRALDDAGALQPAMSDAWRMLERDAERLVEAGAIAGRHDLTGQLIDVLG